MLILAFGVTALVHRYLQTYSPSNAIVARVRREQPSPQIAIGLLAVSAALASGAVLLADWAASGGPGVLNLIVLVAVWDAFKFASLACLVALAALANLRQAQDSATEAGRDPHDRGLQRGGELA